MVNYIKSEAFRVVKNKNMKIMMVFCILLLSSLVTVLYFCKQQVGFPYANTKFALGNIYTSMTLILMLTLVIAIIVDDSEYKHHTIKHSVAFGISRFTIYFGRFLTMVVSATIIYVVLTGFLTVTSLLFLDYSNVGEIMTLCRISAASYTSLIAGLAVTFFFLMVLENPAIAATWSMLILFALPVITQLLGRKFVVMKVISKCMPSNCIDSGTKLISSNGLDMHAAIFATVVGLCWTICFLALGFVLFQKKEIK